MHVVFFCGEHEREIVIGGETEAGGLEAGSCGFVGDVIAWMGSAIKWGTSRLERTEAAGRVSRPTGVDGLLTLGATSVTIGPVLALIDLSWIRRLATAPTSTSAQLLKYYRLPYGVTQVPSVSCRLPVTK